MAEKFDITKNLLVPKHTKITEKERKQLLEKGTIDFKNLPKILKKDPAIAKLDVKEGDIIKIVRTSLTAGESIFYRRVVNA